MRSVTRRVFLKLTALAAGALAHLCLVPPAASAMAPVTCKPQVETTVPLSVPMAVGAECVYPVYLPHVNA